MKKILFGLNVLFVKKILLKKTSCPANVVKIFDNIRRFDLLIDLSTSLKERLPFPSIEKKCCEEKAVFHKTCKNKFDDYHFGRVSGKKKKNNDGDDDKASPNLIKTRSNFTATNFQKSCFFCESSSHEPLHVIQTFKVDQNIRKAANILMDERLIAKLSEGDLVATEAVYHRSCLVNLYNKVRVVSTIKTEDQKKSERLKGTNLLCFFCFFCG